MEKNMPIQGYTKWHSTFLENFKQLQLSDGDRFLKAVAMNHPKVGDSEEIYKVLNRIRNYQRKIPGENIYSRTVYLDDVYACCKAANLSPNEILYNSSEEEIPVKNTTELLQVIKSFYSDKNMLYFFDLILGNDSLKSIELPNNLLFRRFFLWQVLSDVAIKIEFLQEVNFKKTREEYYKMQSFIPQTASIPKIWRVIKNFLLEKYLFDEKNIIKIALENFSETPRMSKLYKKKDYAYDNMGKEIEVRKSWYIKAYFFRLLFESAIATIDNISKIAGCTGKVLLIENPDIGLFLKEIFMCSLCILNQYVLCDGLGRKINEKSTSTENGNIYKESSHSTKKIMNKGISLDKIINSESTLKEIHYER